MDISISVVIPTLNAANRLPVLLEAISEQTVGPVELIVVDSSSEDGTAELAECFGAKVKSISRSSFNHGLTRHEAFLESNGDIVCFLTDDAVPTSNRYLEELIAPFQDSKVALVSGRQLPKADARRFEQLVREFNYPSESSVRTAADIPELGIKAFFASDVCSAYRRSAYFECGGFGKCSTNEDMLMAARFINTGYKVAYAADAQVFHSHNLTPRQQYRRNKAVGYFLATHKAELCDVEETGEGVRLAKTVAAKLIAERKLLELFTFGVDCVARLAGNRAGKKMAAREEGGNRR